MNRGLFTYLKESSKTVNITFRNNKLNYFKFYLWIISSFLGKLFFVSYPAFAIMDQRISTKVNENQNIDLLESLEKADNKQTFITTLMCSLVKGLIFLGGFITILFITALFAGLGYLIGSLNDSSSLSLILAIALGAPGLIAEIIYCFEFILFFTPVNFIINRRDDELLSKVLFISALNMKKDGKKTLFAINLICFLFQILFLGLSGGLSYLCISNSSSILKIIGYILVVIFLGLFFIINARAILIKKVSIIKLFEDIINYDLEKEVIVKKEKVKENNPKENNKKKQTIETRSKEEILISLFDDKAFKEAKLKEQNDGEDIDIETDEEDNESEENLENKEEDIKK